MPVLQGNASPSVSIPQALRPVCGTNPLDDPQAESRQWWAVYTRNRREKQLAQVLHDHGIPFYLPLVEARRLGGKELAHVPLFASYLFLLGTARERILAMSTRLVTRILPVENQEQLRSDLVTIHRLVGTNRPMRIDSLCPPARGLMRIAHGELTGVQGMVTQEDGENRLVVRFNYLNQGVSFPIEDAVLEPIAA